MNTIANTMIFLCLVVAMAYVGPALDEADALADEALQQVKQQQADERRDRAARDICGQNAVFNFEGSKLTCYTKRSRKTRTMEVKL